MVPIQSVHQYDLRCTSLSPKAKPNWVTVYHPHSWNSDNSRWNLVHSDKKYHGYSWLIDFFSFSWHSYHWGRKASQNIFNLSSQDYISLVGLLCLFLVLLDEKDLQKLFKFSYSEATGVMNLVSSFLASCEELVNKCIMPKLKRLLKRANLLIWCECDWCGKTLSCWTLSKSYTWVGRSNNMLKTGLLRLRSNELIPCESVSTTYSKWSRVTNE